MTPEERAEDFPQEPEWLSQVRARVAASPVVPTDRLSRWIIDADRDRRKLLAYCDDQTAEIVRLHKEIYAVEDRWMEAVSRIPK